MIRLLGDIRIVDPLRQPAEAQDAKAADAELNREVAARLRIAADHFEAHDVTPYRAASYRRAADTVAAQPLSVGALYDEHGRKGLNDLPGIGPGIAAIIDDILRKRSEAGKSREPRRPSCPPVALLLDADREFRLQRRTASGDPAARQPPGRIPGAARELCTRREGWALRVFFSSSLRAQELARTRDWVIVIATRGDGSASQHTIVTETRGKLAGRRVVRGREAACRSHYARITPAAR